MTTDPSPIERFQASRKELLALLDELPETRLSKPTTRQGWTLRHELSWLAAADEELLQRLEIAFGSASDEPHWRRVRGQAMHAAQELRLAALREHLGSSGERASASLRTHEPRLHEVAIRGNVEDHESHTQTALAALRTALGR